VRIAETEHVVDANIEHVHQIGGEMRRFG